METQVKLKTPIVRMDALTGLRRALTIPARPETALPHSWPSEHWAALTVAAHGIGTLLGELLMVVKTVSGDLDQAVAGEVLEHVLRHADVRLCMYGDVPPDGEVTAEILNDLTKVMHATHERLGQK
jgi:hypothetical protein